MPLYSYSTFRQRLFCGRFSSLETSAIDLNISHSVQFGQIRVPTFFGNLTFGQKLEPFEISLTPRL